MKPFGPRGMIVLGSGLVVAGFIIPFLMVIGVMEPTFLVAFLSYAASLGGVIVGMFGAAFYVHERRR